MLVYPLILGDIYIGSRLKGLSINIFLWRIISSDVNRGSKNRNSLQFRVLEIEFLNSKLDFTFW